MSDTIELSCSCGAKLKAEVPRNGFESPDQKKFVARWIEIHRCGHEQADTRGKIRPLLPARGETENGQ